MSAAATATSVAVPQYGGSASAVQYHYDVGRDFYKLWLDPTMTYSCALWDLHDKQETLEQAQQRKIDWHLDSARVAPGGSLLDIGCGWGGLVSAASRQRQCARMVGLTLSEDQAAYVNSLALPGMQVRLESWTDHKPTGRYDSIISVGAFEHFAKPEDSIAQKIEVYRDFLERCAAWLAPDGRMSLQTIAYGTMAREEASEFINNEIFPSADLPTLDEVVQAAQGIFEVCVVRNDRLHYARTFAAWAENLRRSHGKAVALVGDDVTRRYERYLTQSSVGFMMGKISLLRFELRPVERKWLILARP